MKRLSDNYTSNVKMLDTLLRVEDSFDIIKRQTKYANGEQTFYYIDGFIKGESMQKLFVHFHSVKSFGNGTTGDGEKFAREHTPAVEVDVSSDAECLVVSVLSGCTVMLADAFPCEALVIDLRTYPARDASEPENDKVMRGSRDGFVETLMFNTAMLRRRIRNPKLTVEYISVGRSSKTDIALCYINDRVDTKLLYRLRKKLKSSNTDSVSMGHESIAEILLRKRWYNPFPKFRLTERPDVATASVLEGSVVLICDNSPEAMLFPTSVFDFLQEADDYYFSPFTGTYLRIIRHLVFWLSVVLTPIWYLAISNADILPAQLLFLVPKEPGAIPVILQLFLTEFALDGLKLASLNTPDALSSSLSVVGGLLLGDFAVKVGILCPDVILYMAFVATANFTQSSYELGYAFKYLRMFILLLTSLFNFWGFAAGFAIGLLFLCTNRSFGGKSYLYPLIPFNGKALVRLLFRPLKHD